MSAITLDYPLESLPGLPLREGQRFHGYVQGGKVHVTVQIPEPAKDEGAASPDEPVVRENAARHFVEKWHGAFTRASQDELDADPRLAYLTAKHLP